jgi:sugar phosphate permease
VKAARLGYHWIVLLLVCLSSTAISYIAQGLPALVPLFQSDLNLSRAQAGALIAAMNLGPLLSSLGVGRLIDRVGERPVLVGGTLGTGLAVLAASRAPNFVLLAFFLFVTGIFASVSGPGGTKVIMVWFPQSLRGLGIGIRQTSIPLGGAVAAATLPLLGLAWGWRGALALAGIVVAATAFVVQAFFRDRPAGTVAARHTGQHGIRTLLRSRSVLAIMGVAFILTVAQWATVTYLVLFLHEYMALDLPLAASYLAVLQIGGVGGRAIWGLLSDTLLHGRRKPAMVIIAPAAVVCVVLLALLPVGSSPLLLVPLVAAIGFTAVGWNGIFLALMAEQGPPELAATAVGLGVTGVFVSIVLTPPLFGLVVDQSGSYQVAWWLLAAILVCSLPLLRWIQDGTRWGSVR